MPRFSNIFTHLVGIALIVSSFVSLVIFGIISLFADAFVVNHYVLFAVFCLSPFCLGIFIFMKARQHRQMDKRYELEVAAMKYAAKGEGKVTVPEIAMKFSKPVLMVDEVMRDLQSRGIFEVMVSEDGVLVYKLNHTVKKSTATAI